MFKHYKPYIEMPPPNKNVITNLHRQAWILHTLLCPRLRLLQEMFMPICHFSVYLRLLIANPNKTINEEAPDWDDSRT